MTRIITALFAVACTLTAFGQHFEGKIVYKNSYTSKMAGVTSEQFTAMMGASQDYFIQNGNYKSVSNGLLVQWQLYVNKDNKLYSKMVNEQAILWNDASVNPDEIIKAVINKGVAEILGYTCHELVLTCKSGVQKYYFSTKLSVNAGLFINHKFGNWYDYISRSNALPLKSIIDNDQFTVESVATEIKEMNLEKTIFELPEGAKTAKSPYLQ